MKVNYSGFDFVLAILSGLLITISFPPYNLHWMAWFALTPLFWILLNETDTKRSLIFVSVFASVCFGGVLSWLLAINHWYPFCGWLAWGGVVVSGIIISMFWLGLVRLCWRVLPSRVIAPALLWGLIEWVRQFGVFGSSLGWLGYTQWKFLPVAQLATYIGVPGISVIIVFVNLLLVDLFTMRRNVFRTVLLLISVGFLSVGLGNVRLQREIKPLPFSLAIIQPNISQDQKLDPSNYAQLKAQYLEMVNKVAQTAQVIFLPETIVPVLLAQDRVFMGRLFKGRENAPSYYIFGTPYQHNSQIFNSAVVVKKGIVVDRYDKVHLVPFGEYLPVPNFLRPLFTQKDFFANDYQPGKLYRPVRIGEYNLGLGICFESYLPTVYKAFSKNGAEVLAVITNDAWFLDSAGAEQHLMVSVFRAIENNKWMIQCANTGISGIIDPYGRVVSKSKLNTREVIEF